jgi:hypothetical protein
LYQISGEQAKMEGWGEEIFACEPEPAPPHRPNTWRAEPRRKISSSFLEEKNLARAKRELRRIFFCEVAAGAIAEAGGGARAYYLVQSHHAPSAWSVGVLGEKGSDFVQKVPPRQFFIGKTRMLASDLRPIWTGQ